MGYRAKLLLAFLTLGILTLGVTIWEASRRSTAALSAITEQHLLAVRQTQIRLIEQWFQDLGNHTLALSSDEATITALEDFSRSWATLPRAAPDALRGIYNALRVEPAWFPSDPRVIALQHQFIAANPNPIGHKDQILGAPGPYGRAHARFHPTLHRYQSAFSFYDVLLIGTQDARVVYSVRKEFDLGASLDAAPHQQSALGVIYRKAMAIAEPERYVLQDFAEYPPSHSLPAAFLAAPVWRAGSKAGVLAIQVSMRELDRIMATERPGAKGRVSILGADGKVRIGPGPSTTPSLASEDVLKIPGLDWELRVEMDRAEAMAPVRDLEGGLLLIAALGAVAIFIAASTLASSVVKPVRALAAAADRLGRRDFTSRIPVTSNDEIGELARSFNHMAGQLESTTASKAELEDYAARLITAQEDERQRLGRELHDDFSQRLAALAMDPDPSRQRIAQLAREVHDLSRRLHPKILEDLGLTAAAH